MVNVIQKCLKLFRNIEGVALGNMKLEEEESKFIRLFASVSKSSKLAL